MNLRHITVLTILICSNLISAAQKRNWAKAADSAQQALTTQFWSTEEKYYKHNNDNNPGFDYWWNAHALDVLVDGYIRTKDAAYTTRMKDLLTGMHKKNGNKWENNYDDDMEWLAIACIRAYEATKDAKFKELAQELWTMIKPAGAMYTAVALCGQRIIQIQRTPAQTDLLSSLPPGCIN